MSSYKIAAKLSINGQHLHPKRFSSTQKMYRTPSTRSSWWKNGFQTGWSRNYHACVLPQTSASRSMELSFVFYGTRRFECSSMVWSIWKYSSWRFIWNFVHRHVHGQKILHREDGPTMGSIAVAHTHRNQVADISHHFSHKNWEEMSTTIFCLARQTVVPLHTNMWSPVNALVTGLFQPEPTFLDPNFSVLYVAPGIMQHTNTHVFWALISNLSSIPWRLPKHMVLAHETAPPPLILSQYAIKDLSGMVSENNDRTVAAVHFKLKVNREVHKKWHEKVYSPDWRTIKHAGGKKLIYRTTIQIIDKSSF